VKCLTKPKLKNNLWRKVQFSATSCSFRSLTSYIEAEQAMDDKINLFFYFFLFSSRNLFQRKWKHENVIVIHWSCSQCAHTESWSNLFSTLKKKKNIFNCRIYFRPITLNNWVPSNLGTDIFFRKEIIEYKLCWLFSWEFVLCSIFFVVSPHWTILCEGF